MEENEVTRGSRDIEGIEFGPDGAIIRYEIRDLQIMGESDLYNLLVGLAPLTAKSMIDAKMAGKRDWSVSGSVSTSSGGTTATVGGSVGGRDWQVSGSASTSVGSGMTGSVTVTHGSGGTSGSVGLSGTF